MPAKSKTDNVRKRCDCATWKTCAHPWYLDYQRKNVRFRDNLDKLIGRHAPDFAAAQDEAKRAIVAKLDGRDPKDLQPDDDPTLAELLAGYTREKGARRDRWQVGRILAIPLRGVDGERPFGEWRMSTIKPDTLKQFRRQRPLVAGNRDLTLLRAAFNWAVLGELLPSSPFRVGDVPAVKLGREQARTRRLQPGEAERLLMTAGRARDMIVAALETGMRKGELLSLQWDQVRFAPRPEIFLPAQKTKTKKDRRVPITSVLRAVLDARRHDPAGNPLPPAAFVFGDEIGRPRTSIKRAWESAVLRAHGYAPAYVKRAASDPTTAKRRRRTTATLTPECREHLRAIDLHFHDLRREAGSRWMDAGVPLATIQRWLGHTNIAQTSTYLGASLGNDERDMRAFEERIGRVPPVTESDANSGSNGRNPTRSETEMFEKTQQNRIEPKPTVH